MPLPTTRDELLANLKKAYEKLDAEFDDIDSGLERDKGIERELSCCDIIAYQLGWGKLLISWDSAELAGRIVVMPSADFKWNQLGELANTFYKEYSQQSLKQLRTEFQNLYLQLVEWICALTEVELFVPKQRCWTGEKWAMVKWIQINTIAPYQSARTKVRRWKKEISIQRV